MYLLDTNVVSESRKLRGGTAHPGVMAWLAATSPGTTFISIHTVFELELGIRLKERQDLAQGQALRRWLETVVLPGFGERILTVDVAIATRCAGLQVPDPVSERDAWIAAIALEHGLTVVTRDVKDFARTGVALLNPWD